MVRKFTFVLWIVIGIIILLGDSVSKIEYACAWICLLAYIVVEMINDGRR